ncbi:MAG: sulfotransferase family protein [Nocardioides sp.]
MPHALRRYFDYKLNRANYLTHISRRYHAVFLEVPKAGCTVVKRVLQVAEDPAAADVATVHDRASSPLAGPLRDGFDADELFGPSSDWFTFTFVRNPYSRALSCYLEKVAGLQRLSDMRLPKLGLEPGRDVSFREFLELLASDRDVRDADIHWTPQATLLSLDRVSYDFIGRFESFAPDLERMLARLGIEGDPELVQRRTTHETGAGSRLQEHYDDACADLVRSIYAEDFERLGYGRDARMA